jgi:3-hydroxyacyl-CoA dehydrogenase/3-hydroxy-2-methylbutyryl-CoA dehydrogenase
MEVNGARVLVTGGASGLGNGVVTRLGAAGAKVGILDLPTSSGAEAAEHVGGCFAEADVRDPDAVAAAVDHIGETLGGLDVCVNAAGVANAARVINRSGDLFPIDLFQFVVGVNLIGTFDVLRNAVKIMADNEPDDEGGRGLIVNVASIAATEGQIGQAAYSASKGGVAAMTLPLARDLAAIGVRVMTIAPGIMDTPMIDGMGPELKAELAKIHVFPQRLGTPDDFAALVQHFMENTLLNGEVVRLDAGARMGPR